MEASWVSIGITAIVLIVQLTNGYNRGERSSESNIKDLETLFTKKLAEIQVQIAKLPDDLMTRVGQSYVTSDRYTAELEGIRSRLRALEQSVHNQ